LKIKSYCKACKSDETICLVPGSHRAQGKVVYTVDFLLGGKPPKGTRVRKMFKGGITKDEVKKWAYGQITDFDRGILIPMDKAKTPFKEIIDKYFNEHLIPKRRRDFAPVHTYLKQIKEMLGEYQIGTITLGTLEKIRTQFKEKHGLSNSSVNRIFSTIKTAFNRAVEWDYIRVSPAKFLHDLPTEPTKPRFLTTEELARVFEQFKKDIRVLDYATALAHTGIRPIDLKSLAWSQVDFTTKNIFVTTYKGNRPRNYATPIDETLLGVLQRRFNETKGQGLVFNTRFNHKLIEGMIDKSGVNVGKSFNERFTFYGLKHCYISHLIMSGADIFHVSQLVNVSVTTLQKHYIHLTTDHLRKAQERINLTPPLQQQFEVI
jgi:integrase